MTMKWTFAIPALAAGALLLVATVVPSGPAQASNEKKCMKQAKQLAGGQSAGVRKALQRV